MTETALHIIEPPQRKTPLHDHAAKKERFSEEIFTDQTQSQTDSAAASSSIIFQTLEDMTNETILQHAQDTVHAFFQTNGFECISQTEHQQILHPTLAHYERYGDITLVIMTDTVVDTSALQSIHADIVSQTTSKRGNLVFLIVNTHLHPETYRQMATYKSQENIIFIPLAIQLLRKALRQGNSPQILEKIVSNHVRGKNWYETSTPVENPLEFFGREEMLTTLGDAVSHVQHIGLFGLRKIGKTSLIWQLREKLSQHIVAYVDLQQTPQELSCVYDAILEECLREISDKYPDVTLPEFHCFTQETTANESVQFCQILVGLWEYLHVKSHDVKIVLLFDEADHLIPSGREIHPGFSKFHHLIGTIRGISQRYGFLVSLMVSSSPNISRLDTWKGQNNPGFQFYKEIFLSTLTEEECNHMIHSLGNPMGVRYTEESLSRIYYETGGHPYVTRQLCSLIVQHIFTPHRHAHDAAQACHIRQIPGNDSPAPMVTVEVKDVEDAVSEYLEYHYDYLESIWQRLSQIEQDLLHIILTHESCALDDLMSGTHNHQSKRERRKAISNLIENEIIEKCENKYSMRMGVFEQYLLTMN